MAGGVSRVAREDGTTQQQCEATSENCASYTELFYLAPHLLKTRRWLRALAPKWLSRNSSSHHAALF